MSNEWKGRLPLDEMPDTWVGRNACGCITGLCSGEADMRESAAGFAKEYILLGGTVEKVKFRKYYDELRNEPTFFMCDHVEVES